MCNIQRLSDVHTHVYEEKNIVKNLLPHLKALCSSYS
jgi:hypothetical protein